MLPIKNKIDFLRENSVFWSRLGFGFDPPQIDDDGHHKLFCKDYQRYCRFHQSFINAGIKIHSTILPSGWVGVDRYDYTVTDEIVDALLKGNPEILYLPRVKLNVPVDWCRENPRDVFVYSNGPRQETEIVKITGTLQHDWLGYDSQTGYGVNGGTFKDSRPNVNGLIGLQSFSSQKWLADGGEALVRLIQHLENGPYGRQIIGYHIAYGNCGETTLWGSWSQNAVNKGDYGINAREAFYMWGLQKYGSPERLMEAWKIDERTYYDRETPDVNRRFLQNYTLKEFFRGREQDTVCIDYSRFTSDANIKAINHFCRLVKQTAVDKVVGAFYGYIIGVAQSSHAGHLNIDSLLSSPWVDFLSSPKGYYRCGADGPGLDQAAATSINRKKLWLDEVDNVTHLDIYRNGHGKTNNFLETQTVLWREFSKNISWNQGYWWMDLGEGAFDSSEVMAEIQKMEAMKKELINSNKCISGFSWEENSISEVLLVIDDESMHYYNPSEAFTHSFIKNFASDIKQCGVPVDLYRFSDLTELNLKKYKVAVFLNQFILDKIKWTKIREKFNKNITLIWNYAAGAISATHDNGPKEEFMLDNVTKITGFVIREYSEGMLAEPKKVLASGSGHGLHEVDFPLIEVVWDDEIKILKEYDGGACKVGMKRRPHGGLSILCCLPALTIDDLHDIFMCSSVHPFAPKYCTVYGNNRFIAVFTGKSVSGCIKLKNNSNIHEVISNTYYHNIDEIPISMDAKRCAVFKYI